MNRLDCTADPSFKDLDGQLLSAHGFIRRQGQLIQFVELSKRAWHAGESHWQNRVNCNDFSIGIELEGSEDESFTDAQYRTLVDVIADTVSAYPGLSLSRIVGHHEIAPHRKTDPGLHFDWLRVFTASQQRIRAGH